MSIDLPSTGVLKIQISARFNQILGQLQISILNRKVKSSPKGLSKSINWKTYLNFENIPSIGVLKIQISAYINQICCHFIVTILNSQVENSPKISTKSMYWKTYLNFENIPSIGVLKIQIGTWFNQFLGQLQISILNSKVKSSS